MNLDRFQSRLVNAFRRIVMRRPIPVPPPSTSPITTSAPVASPKIDVAEGGSAVLATQLRGGEGLTATYVVLHLANQSQQNAVMLVQVYLDETRMVPDQWETIALAPSEVLGPEDAIVLSFPTIQTVPPTAGIQNESITIPPGYISGKTLFFAENVRAGEHSFVCIVRMLSGAATVEWREMGGWPTGVHVVVGTPVRVPMPFPETPEIDALWDLWGFLGLGSLGLDQVTQGSLRGMVQAALSALVSKFPLLNHAEACLKLDQLDRSVQANAALTAQQGRLILTATADTRRSLRSFSS